MKKTIFALPCMAAIALAAFVGMRTLERNKNINETLLMANVEALTEEEISTQKCSRATIYGSCYRSKKVTLPNGQTVTMPEFVGLHVDAIEIYEVAIGSPIICKHDFIRSCPDGAYPS